MSASTLAQPYQEVLAFTPLPSQGDRSRRKKRGADRCTAPASIEAFELLKTRRRRLYRPILEILAAHGPEPSACLTARELLRKLKASGQLPLDAERNNVSPRLSELLAVNVLENPENYLKVVVGDSNASVWRVTAKGRLLLDHLRNVGAERQ